MSSVAVISSSGWVGFSNARSEDVRAPTASSTGSAELVSVDLFRFVLGHEIASFSGLKRVIYTPDIPFLKTPLDSPSQ